FLKVDNRSSHYFLKAMKKFYVVYFGQLLIASSDYTFLCSTFCLVKLPPTHKYTQYYKLKTDLQSIVKNIFYVLINRGVCILNNFVNCIVVFKKYF
ncbi:MAG: hypothetical protein WCY89_12475, partial [Flavobacteriaceae bacterium]